MRESNFDLLRICCCIAVIVMHIAGAWYGFYIMPQYQGNISTIDAIITTGYHNISSFAVPCFVMLSGAFILDDGKNKNYKSFYKKIFKKVGVQTVIFSIAYTLFQVPIALLDGYASQSEIMQMIKNLLYGAPFNHMWYLYMMIGIYALAPWVIRFKDEIGEAAYAKVTIVFMVLATISIWTIPEIKIKWNIGMSFCYLGYFSMGYIIRKHKNNSKLIGWINIVIGLSIFVINACLDYCINIAKMPLLKDFSFQKEPMFPLVVVASILIFNGFKNFSFKRNFGKLAGDTLYIYLFQSGIIYCIVMALQLTFGASWFLRFDCKIYIPLLIGIVFVLSWTCTKIYIYLYSKLDRRIKVTDKIAKIFRLL